MSRKLLFGLAACAVLSFASNAIAASDTRLIGNPDGKAFVSECPPGKAVVGWKYNSDDRLRAVVALCNMIDTTTGAVGGAIRPASNTLIGGDFGHDGGGGGSGERICSYPTHAVYRLSVNLTNILTVHSLRAECKGPGSAPGLMRQTDLAPTAPAAAAKGNVDCGTKAYATALIGTFRNTGPTQGIWSIGLRCQPLGEAPTTTANAGDGGDGGGNHNGNDNGNDQADVGGDEGGGKDGFRIEVDIGPNGIQIGNGDRRDGNRVRFAGEPTTVYAKPAGKEIAYLEEGQRVVIVGCEDGGQGWCQISRPVKGFVWGADLD